MLGINKLLAFLRRQVGLRTDAASATGSLHAKIAEELARIGTSANTRASNTVMGWLNSPIKSIQRGQTAVPSLNSATDVSISSVTTTKSFVSLSYAAYTSHGTISYLGGVFAHLTSDTNLRIENRGGDPRSIGGSVAWEVVEFY